VPGWWANSAGIFSSEVECDGLDIRGNSDSVRKNKFTSREGVVAVPVDIGIVWVVVVLDKNTVVNVAWSRESDVDVVGIETKGTALENFAGSNAGFEIVNVLWRWVGGGSGDVAEPDSGIFIALTEGIFWAFDSLAWLVVEIGGTVAENTLD